MRPAAFILASLLLAALPFQEPAHDGELEKLVQCVLRLREAGTDDAVKAALMADESWTLMTEIGMAEGECLPWEECEVFSVNDFAVDIAEQRVGKNRSAGLFCNGLDPAFHHSFIEKDLRPGAEVQYVLPERKGWQEVVLVPFYPDTELVAELLSDGYLIPLEEDESHCFRARFTAGQDGNIRLVIQNRGDRPEAVVLLNYNARR